MAGWRDRAISAPDWRSRAVPLESSGSTGAGSGVLPPGYEAPGIGDVGRMAGEGATMGLGDRLRAGAEALVSPVLPESMGGVPGEATGDAYDRALAENRTQTARSAQRLGPLGSLAAQGIGGLPAGIAMMPAKGAQVGAGLLGRLATRLGAPSRFGEEAGAALARGSGVPQAAEGLGSLGRVMAPAAVQGAVQGAAATPDMTTPDVLGNVAHGATQAAGTAGLLTVGGDVARQGLGAVARPLLGYARQKGREVLQGGATLAKANTAPLSNAVVDKAAEVGAFGPLGTRQDAADKLFSALESVGNDYGAVLKTLQDNGIRGPNAEALAREIEAAGRAGVERGDITSALREAVYGKNAAELRAVEPGPAPDAQPPALGLAQALQPSQALARALGREPGTMLGAAPAPSLGTPRSPAVATALGDALAAPQTLGRAQLSPPMRVPGAPPTSIADETFWNPVAHPGGIPEGAWQKTPEPVLPGQMRQIPTQGTPGPPTPNMVPEQRGGTFFPSAQRPLSAVTEEPLSSISAGPSLAYPEGRQNFTMLRDAKGDLPLAVSEAFKRRLQREAKYGAYTDTLANEQKKDLASLVRQANEDTIAAQLPAASSEAQAAGAQFVPLKQEYGLLAEGEKSAARAAGQAQRHTGSLHSAMAMAPALVHGNLPAAAGARVAESLIRNRWPSTAAWGARGVSDLMQRLAESEALGQGGNVGATLLGQLAAAQALRRSGGNP